jgi:serine-type D-Ala-D-Ala carboxypeptidase/endopeptidase (penicillin-binding protein 4)
MRVVVAAVALALAAPAALAPPASAALRDRLERMVQASGLGGTATTAAVFDRTSRRFLYRHHARAALVPASNMKLVTAATALARLGTHHRMRTRVFATGRLSGGRLGGSLWIVGGGDPTFSKARFARKVWGGRAGLVGRLADAVRHAGIRRVSGRVYGDESRFDRRRRGPFWPPRYKDDCPPLSALSVNADLVRLEGGGVYRDPALRAAKVMRRALARRGVRFAGIAATRRTPRDARLIATERSPTVARLVRQMNVPSDNYHAEILAKGIGAHVTGRGTTAAGTFVAARYLRRLGIPRTGARLLDGSGLSPRNHLSARLLVGLLARARRAPYGYYFRRSLPVAGRSGTLEDRMRTGPAAGNARAKTGTLRNASALSGYVRARNGHRLAFSIISNARRIDVDAARRLQDRMVQEMAASSPR